MLIGFGMPSLTTTVGGTGAAAVTSTDALVDGSPGSVTRFTWASGAQTTSTTVTLTQVFTAQTVVRCLCLLGTTLPVGLKVEVKGKRAIDGGYTYDLGGNSLTQHIVEFPDGSRGAWWVFNEGLDAVTGIRVTLYNDVGGATSLSASDEFDIGELAPFQGIDVCIRRTLQDTIVDPSRLRRSPNNQPNKLFRRPYRVLRMDFAPRASVTDLRTLRYDLATTVSCAVIPIYLVAGTTTLDTDVLHETAMYGTMTDPISIVAVSDGRYWEGSMAFEEYPPA